MKPAAKAAPAAKKQSDTDAAFIMSKRIARLRMRGEAIHPNLFDNEANVEGELRFLLDQTPEACRDALPLIKAAMEEADPGSVLRMRHEFIMAIVEEQAAAPEDDSTEPIEEVGTVV